MLGLSLSSYYPHRCTPPLLFIVVLSFYVSTISNNKLERDRATFNRLVTVAEKDTTVIASSSNLINTTQNYSE